MGSGLMSACADQEWKTCARSSRETCAPRAGSVWICGSGKVLIGRGLSCVCGLENCWSAGKGEDRAVPRLVGDRGVVVHDVLDVGVLVERVGRHVLAEAAVPVA